jgi:hypothetical protein
MRAKRGLDTLKSLLLLMIAEFRPCDSVLKRASRFMATL